MLTDKQIKYIVDNYQKDYDASAIARKMGLSRNVILGTAWRRGLCRKKDIKTNKIIPDVRKINLTFGDLALSRVGA